jgi:hypothetical protein
VNLSLCYTDSPVLQAASCSGWEGARHSLNARLLSRPCKLVDLGWFFHSAPALQSQSLWHWAGVCVPFLQSMSECSSLLSLCLLIFLSNTTAPSVMPPLKLLQSPPQSHFCLPRCLLPESLPVYRDLTIPRLGSDFGCPPFFLRVHCFFSP